jgi:hypothetical protein
MSVPSDRSALPLDPAVELQKLAFTWHMAREIVVADSETRDAELAWLDARCPPALLREVGFLDDAGPTELFVDALGRAVVELPDRLTPGEKLALLEGLVDVTAADGVLAAEEMDALAAAARMLGVEEAAWTGLVEEALAAGQLQTDECRREAP